MDSDATSKLPPAGLRAFSDLGEAFHTALRKGVDSPFSTLAWNLLHLCPAEVWNSIIEFARKKLETNSGFDSVSLRDAFCTWEHAFDETSPEGDSAARAYTRRIWKARDGATWALCLSVLMRTMPFEDWDSLATTLAYWLDFPSAWSVRFVKFGDLVLLQDERILRIIAVRRNGTIVGQAYNRIPRDGTSAQGDISPFYGQRWRPGPLVTASVSDISLEVRRQAFGFIIRGDAIEKISDPPNV